MADMHARHIANLPSQYIDAARALSKARALKFLTDIWFPIFKSAVHVLYRNKTIPLTSHNDYPRFPYGYVRGIVDNISDAPKLAGSVLGQEVEVYTVPAPVSQHMPARDGPKDEADPSDVREDNKARRSLSRTSPADLEFRTHDVPSQQGIWTAVS
ncbi:uncharacterized protein BT62DRAFT_1004706 [Guyanagaster necrorhizus]|uniref:Uncharacterized protein n=1 Tax=Guyanagaster necrorhizus TaxID=856835 RepID=A0A9P7VUU8_9AGAR|nr:uncharacterized protein BT62DRAFT_1004706 [Guyanagaster necrorhizus MCA 3950]KAG7447130.1 hypothetical protein BT62DRAFT_1004706 [Guyanagaster necrorhizus MCA 3950]